MKASLTYIFIFLVLNNLHLCLINKYKHINISGIKQESCQYFEKISSILLSLDLQVATVSPSPYNRRKESSWCSYYIIILYNVNDLRVSLKSHGTYCFGFHINILFSMEFTRRLQLCSVLHIWLSGGQEVIVDEMV